MKKILQVLTAAIFAFCSPQLSTAEQNDILRRIDGRGEIRNALEWNQTAVPMIIDFFDSQIYGEIPPRPDTIKFELLESSRNALGGIAVRKQYRITVGGKKGEHSFAVLIYLPKGAEGKIPAFICPNFYGNHALTAEREVFLPTHFVRGENKNADREKSRGAKADRIPAREIVARGFAIATYCYNEGYPDYIDRDGAPESIYKIFDNSQTPQKTALSAWAWCNMRVFDLLETLPEIDTQKIGVVGHSRLAKTAFITGAHDKRFAYVCGNNGGAKTITLMPNLRFKFWFSQNIKRYTNTATTGVSQSALKKERDASLEIPPADQWHLMACIAPRMLYVAGSSGDIYAQPDIQREAVIKVSPAYKLFGAKNLPTLTDLMSDKPFFGDIGFHIKEGPHSITPTDWNNFIDYAISRGWKPSTKTN